MKFFHASIADSLVDAQRDLLHPERSRRTSWAQPKDILGAAEGRAMPMRAAADPDALLLSFLESTYAAAADLGGWDRASLDRR
jgi:hypothetical protein